MKRRYRKDDVETHSDRGWKSNPAVNVKARNLPYASKVATHLNCSEDQAEKALEFAFTAAQENFWESVQEIADNIFDQSVKVYSEGRSGGWAVVHNLPDIESWDAVLLSKWAKFERIIKAEVVYLTSFERMTDDIEANEWHKDGSEQYNFIDTANGPKCLADLKAEAIAAGFGAVVK